MCNSAGPPPREVPQVMGNPPVSEPGIFDQIQGSLSSIDQNTLIYLVGGSVLLIPFLGNGISKESNTFLCLPLISIFLGSIVKGIGLGLLGNVFILV